MIWIATNNNTSKIENCIPTLASRKESGVWINISLMIISKHLLHSSFAFCFILLGNIISFCDGELMNFHIDEGNKT